MAGDGIINEVILNNQTEVKDSIFEMLFPDLLSKSADLIPILKTAGIIFIAYIIFLIIKNILDIRRNIRITRTYKIVKDIDKKLDLLLGKKEKSREDTSKKQLGVLDKRKKQKKETKKKKSFFRFRKK